MVDNLAILPEFANTLEFKKAVHIKIDNKENKKFNITYLDYANSFSQDGSIQWLNKMPPLWSGSLLANETLVCTVTPGVDHEGDYVINTEGGQSHWVISKEETGNKS